MKSNFAIKLVLLTTSILTLPFELHADVSILVSGRLATINIVNQTRTEISCRANKVRITPLQLMQDSPPKCRAFDSLIINLIDNDHHSSSVDFDTAAFLPTSSFKLKRLEINGGDETNLIGLSDRPINTSIVLNGGGGRDAVLIFAGKQKLNGKISELPMNVSANSKSILFNHTNLATTTFKPLDIPLIAIFGSNRKDVIDLSNLSPASTFKMQIDSNEGDDTIIGSPVKDSINGGPGADLIRGGFGNDLVAGNQGDDSLYGNEGDDHVDGGPGNDELYGGPGSDFLDEEDGNNRLYGNDGDDFIVAPSSNLIIGGRGNDICRAHITNPDTVCE